MKRTDLRLALPVLMALTASISHATVISIDVVAGGSIAVSGDVSGSPFTGQTGLWNELALDADNPVKITLSNLNDGAAATTGVGFVWDVDEVGYHVQVAGSPYDPGVVLVGDNPERSWITGGESPITFKFTGLTIGAQYDLAVYSTGYGDAPESALKSYTINGTLYSDPLNILTTTQTADSNGEIVGIVACGGDAYSWYSEIAGLQLQSVAEVPEPSTLGMFAAFAGVGVFGRRRRK